MAAKIFEVGLTEGAESDLETIFAYLAENRSDDAADALLGEFERTIETLERLPSRGAIPRELENLGI